MSDLTSTSLKESPAGVRSAMTSNGTTPNGTTQGAMTRAATTHSVIARVRQSLGELVPQARYQLSRLGPAGSVGIVAAVAATIVAASALFSLQAANEKLTSQILHAQHQVNAPITPEQGLTRVVTDLPTRGQMPKVLEQVLQQAQQAGIELNKGQYSYSPAAKGDVARYELDFPVNAQYPAVREFIDRILTHIPAAGLHKLTIQRKVVGDSQVTADVRFVIFIRDR